MAEIVRIAGAAMTARAEAAESLVFDYRTAVDSIEWGGANSDCQVYDYERVVAKLDALLKKTPEGMGKKIADMRQHALNISQDGMEGALVETSILDAHRQALHEVCPTHPVLKGKPPSFGVWEAQRRELDSMVSKLAELEKERDHLCKELTQCEEARDENAKLYAEQDAELARLRIVCQEQLAKLEEIHALRARVSELSAERDAAAQSRNCANASLIQAEQRAERMADAGKRLVKLIVEREPMLEAAFHQSDVELDHNFGFRDRALIEAHQGFVAALADQPAQANTREAALIAAGDALYNADGGEIHEAMEQWDAAKQGAQPVETADEKLARRIVEVRRDYGSLAAFFDAARKQEDAS
jgi:hypothetical protein